MLVLQIYRGSHGVLHLHFVDGYHDRYSGGRNSDGAPRSGWCSRRRLARHHGDDRGCIARASDHTRLWLFFASALHLADALRNEIGGAVVERVGVFRQIGEEVADGGRDNETDVLYRCWRFGFLSWTHGCGIV
jgi:hypothetical protein